jgi:hypothetical protein
MTPIVIVAKTGSNARTADVKDCTLYSTKNHLKIKEQTTLTLTEAR